MVLSKQPGYTLEKESAGWKLLAPQAFAADSGTADRIANALRALRATSVADETADAKRLKERGLSPAKIQVQITAAAAGGKDVFRRTLLVGQPGPAKGSVAVKTYAKRDDSPAIFDELFELSHV